jgi:hypothetical protein
MSHSCTLDSFISMYNSKSTSFRESFLKLINNSEDDRISKEEVTGFSSLLVNKNLLELLNTEQSKGYFFNYTIKAGIREQFDVLRFSPERVVNIELKSQLPSKGLASIKNQLIRHKFILSTLKKKAIICCTYITDENKLYLLTEDSELEEIQSNILVRIIPDQYVNEIELDNINLSHLIISPYSQPELFKEHKYFLTDYQFEIRNEIVKSSNRMFLIKGGPGTGKTMLLFDLARKYVDKGKKVIIVFSGNKDNYLELSTILNIDIKPIKTINIPDLESYDVVLIDEAQRLWENAFGEIVDLKKPKLVFSTDHNQTLSWKEEQSNLEKRLIEDPRVEVRELKGKIRTDPAMASFIKKFLNRKAKGIKKCEYPKVKVEYFATNEMAEKYIHSLVTNENYVSIELTDYTTKTTFVRKREKIYYGSETTHSVIGEEYDNVLVPLDKYFYYNEEAKLVSNYKDYHFYYPYIEESCIFEALTRTKGNLKLVVINNPQLFTIIQELLTWHKNN